MRPGTRMAAEVGGHQPGVLQVSRNSTEGGKGRRIEPHQSESEGPKAPSFKSKGNGKFTDQTKIKFLVKAAYFPRFGAPDPWFHTSLAHHWKDGIFMFKNTGTQGTSSDGNKIQAWGFASQHPIQSLLPISPRKSQYLDLRYLTPSPSSSRLERISSKHLKKKVGSFTGNRKQTSRT